MPFLKQTVCAAACADLARSLRSLVFAPACAEACAKLAPKQNVACACYLSAAETNSLNIETRPFERPPYISIYTSIVYIHIICILHRQKLTAGKCKRYIYIT